MTEEANGQVKSAWFSSLDDNICQLVQTHVLLHKISIHNSPYSNPFPGTRNPDLQHSVMPSPGMLSFIIPLQMASVVMFSLK